MLDITLKKGFSPDDARTILNAGNQCGSIRGISVSYDLETPLEKKAPKLHSASLTVYKSAFSFESMGRRSYFIDRYELAISLYVRVSVIEERR